jgi:hypothetical protein
MCRHVSWVGGCLRCTNVLHLGKYSIYVRGGPNQPLHRDPQWSTVLQIQYLCITAVWPMTLKFAHQLVDPEWVHAGANGTNTPVVHVLSVLEVASRVISASHVPCIK